jgi:hypothetical protein
MDFTSIVLAVCLSYLLLSVLVFGYIKVELHLLRKHHTERNTEIVATPKYQALHGDMKMTFSGYVIRNMNRADRKKVVFQVFRNVFLFVGGLAPVFAMVSTDTDTQKVLNAIASLSVLFLGVLSIERYASEHRRSGYLIDSLIQEWRSEIGDFANRTPEDAFRQLVRRTKEILDTGETSFIGSGAGTEKVAPELNDDEVTELFEEELTEQDIPESSTPVTRLTVLQTITPETATIAPETIPTVLEPLAADLPEEDWEITQEFDKPMNQNEWLGFSATGNPTALNAEDFEIKQEGM